LSHPDSFLDTRKMTPLELIEVVDYNLVESDNNLALRHLADSTEIQVDAQDLSNSTIQALNIANITD
jgi:hypothetical protein